MKPIGYGAFLLPKLYTITTIPHDTVSTFTSKHMASEKQRAHWNISNLIFQNLSCPCLEDDGENSRKKESLIISALLIKN